MKNYLVVSGIVWIFASFFVGVLLFFVPSRSAHRTVKKNVPQARQEARAGKEAENSGQTNIQLKIDGESEVAEVQLEIAE